MWLPLRGCAHQHLKLLQELRRTYDDHFIVGDRNIWCQQCVNVLQPRYALVLPLKFVNRHGIVKSGCVTPFLVR